MRYTVGVILLAMSSTALAAPLNVESIRDEARALVLIQGVLGWYTRTVGEPAMAAETYKGRDRLFSKESIAVVDGASALEEIAQTLGFAPDFLRRFPDGARAGAWREMRDVQLNPSSALSGKTKELVGLAVAAQVPCRFCIIAHTEFAKLNGATEAEINEAIGMASLTRNLSTMLNGLQTDEPQFRRDVDRLVKGARAAAAKQAQAAR